jgi:Tol biopolymer transport system component
VTRRMNVWGRAGLTLGVCAAVAAGGLAPAEGADPVGPGPNLGTLDEVSLTPDGSAGNLNSDNPSISRDGRIVAFTSYASDLVADDTNATSDVFVLDAATGEITLITRNAAGAPANGASITPRVSGNGRYVTYSSFASDLPGPAGATTQGIVYRYDLTTGATELVSHSPNGSYPLKGAGVGDISSNGRFIVYYSNSHNLVPGDHNGRYDIFEWDARTDTTTLVSQAADGSGANKASIGATVSTNGSVVYRSKATNIVPLAGNDFGADIYYWDAVTGVTTLVTTSFDGGFAHGASGASDISGNARYIVFDSLASDLVDEDFTGRQVYVYNTATGETKRVSKSFDGWPGGAASFQPSISDNGRQIAYTTDRWDTDESDTLALNVVVYDRVTGENNWVSTTRTGTVANNTSYLAQISGNGEQIAFASLASNLRRHNDTNKTLDVYIWTRTR